MDNTTSPQVASKLNRTGVAYAASVFYIEGGDPDSNHTNYSHALYKRENSCSNHFR